MRELPEKNPQTLTPSVTIGGTSNQAAGGRANYVKHGEDDNRQP